MLTQNPYEEWVSGVVFSYKCPQRDDIFVKNVKNEMELSKKFVSRIVCWKQMHVLTVFPVYLLPITPLKMKDLLHPQSNCFSHNGLKYNFDGHYTPMKKQETHLDAPNPNNPTLLWTFSCAQIKVLKAFTSTAMVK